MPKEDATSDASATNDAGGEAYDPVPAPFDAAGCLGDADARACEAPPVGPNTVRVRNLVLGTVTNTAVYASSGILATEGGPPVFSIGTDYPLIHVRMPLPATPGSYEAIGSDAAVGATCLPDITVELEVHTEWTSFYRPVDPEECTISVKVDATTVTVAFTSLRFEGRPQEVVSATLTVPRHPKAP